VEHGGKFKMSISLGVMYHLRNSETVNLPLRSGRPAKKRE
jgi:hypothetical protein